MEKAPRHISYQTHVLPDGHLPVPETAEVRIGDEVRVTLCPVRGKRSPSQAQAILEGSRLWTDLSLREARLLRLSISRRRKFFARKLSLE